jgi:very-short-patch-repair endonuclease
MSVERLPALRRSPTDAERRLWQQLRRKQVVGARFRRQVPVGPFYADFLCPAYRLVVEVDGGQHAEHERYDAERTRWLEENGYVVLRFWNNDVPGNIEGVVDTIERWLTSHTPRW